MKFVRSFLARPIAGRSACGGMLALLLFGWVGSPAGAAPAPAPTPATPTSIDDAAPTGTDYLTGAQPVLARHCYECHGPRKQKSKLRLDTPGGIRRGGDSGKPLLVPGDSAASRLIRFVTGVDPEEVMPPDGDRLSAAEVETLRRWIDGGAVMPADAPGVSVEETDPGADGSEETLTTDHWSFQPLKRPEVPLPNDPWVATPVDGFILRKLRENGLTPSGPADRVRLIRRLYLVMHGLLPSPERVERFVKNDDPTAYEQLVEELLRSPRYGERWARHWLDVVRFAETNGFETNRERPTAYPFRDYVIESLNQDKPYDQFVREQIAGDAVGADVATGFLVAGPYDIVKSPDINLTLMQRQDELADMVNTTSTAFLGLTVGCARCHDHKFDPVLQKDFYAMQAVFAGVRHGERKVQSPEHRRRQRKIEHLRTQLTDHRRVLADIERDWRSRVPNTPATDDPADALREPVNPVLNEERFEPVRARVVRFLIRGTTGAEPCIDELEIFAAVDGADRNVALAEAGATASASGTLPGYESHKLEHIHDGRYGNARSWISNTPGGGWVQIEFDRVHTIHRLAWGRDRERRFSDRVSTHYEIQAAAVPDPTADEWNTIASSTDRREYRTEPDPFAFVSNLPQPDQARAQEVLGRIRGLESEVAALAAMGESAYAGTFEQPEVTHRLYRGEPASKREAVAPDALTVTGTLGLAMDAPEQARRVALADWIADENNPLTARVIVNRVWQYHFGSGIVDTPSDFGANGSEPTHPDLLDWLAGEMIRGGWSIKHLHRVILLSSTYRQSSAPVPDALDVDSGCRLLWRFPPRRLEAEAIRDCILQVSGALNLEMGGPGFSAFKVELENVRHYFPRTSFGPAEWRRMIYQTKVRQEKDAVFDVFDCPDGNQVMPERSRSTTPLQALNLFNSQFVLDQADRLARRLESGAGTDVDARIRARIRRGFQLLYSRDPTPAETADTTALIAEHGLEAACRAWLNSNEFLFVF